MGGKAKMHPKRVYGQSEMAAELNIPVDHPHPREAKSQKAQLCSKHKHGTRKDYKIGMHRKIT